jgi:hypothetical protein
MKHKISIPLGIVVIGVVFALGFIVSNQQTFAANLCGNGFCESNPAIRLSLTSIAEMFFTTASTIGMMVLVPTHTVATIITTIISFC